MQHVKEQLGQDGMVMSIQGSNFLHHYILSLQEHHYPSDNNYVFYSEK